MFILGVVWIVFLNQSALRTVLYDFYESDGVGLSLIVHIVAWIGVVFILPAILRLAKSVLVGKLENITPLRLIAGLAGLGLVGFLVLTSSFYVRYINSQSPEYKRDGERRRDIEFGVAKWVHEHARNNEQKLPPNLSTVISSLDIRNTFKDSFYDPQTNQLYTYRIITQNDSEQIFEVCAKFELSRNSLRKNEEPQPRCLQVTRRDGWLIEQEWINQI